MILPRLADVINFIKWTRDLWWANIYNGLYSIAFIVLFVPVVTTIWHINMRARHTDTANELSSIYLRILLIMMWQTKMQPDVVKSCFNFTIWAIFICVYIYLVCQSVILLDGPNTCAPLLHACRKFNVPLYTRHVHERCVSFCSFFFPVRNPKYNMRLIAIALQYIWTSTRSLKR